MQRSRAISTVIFSYDSVAKLQLFYSENIHSVHRTLDGLTQFTYGLTPEDAELAKQLVEIRSCNEFVLSSADHMRESFTTRFHRIFRALLVGHHRTCTLTWQDDAQPTLLAWECTIGNGNHLVMNAIRPTQIRGMFGEHLLPDDLLRQAA